MLKELKTYSPFRAQFLARSTSRQGGQSGQAVMEYLLVLVVVVGIALGVMYQLNTAFKKYVQSYFGEYIACLLETGELPSLGSGDGASAEICSSSFEPFSLKNGRPLISSKDGGSAGKSKSGRSSSKSSSSNRTRGSRVTKNNATLNADRSRGDSTVSAELSKDKKKEFKGSSSGGDDSSTSYRTGRQREEGAVRISSRFKIKSDKEKKTAIKKVEAKGKLASRSTKKIAFDMAKFDRKPAQAEASIGLSFGEYFRYILILALIVVIVIFFGGQLFQLKKSWDKN